MAFFYDRKDADSADAPMRDIEALIGPMAAPALHVRRSDAPTRSHFGGSPGLPADVRWPENGGKPLVFLARLSLAEIDAANAIDWLPREGALLFFYDAANQPWGLYPEDRGGFAVVLVPDLASPPDSISPAACPDAHPAVPHYLTFHQIVTLPGWERPEVEALDLSFDEVDELGDLADGPYDDLPEHQIGGYPQTVQSDRMELECESIKHGVPLHGSRPYPDGVAPVLEPGAANWRLLFQIESDDDLDYMWGDCGKLYFWVEEQAARTGDFANVWLILQCT